MVSIIGLRALRSCEETKMFTPSPDQGLNLEQGAGVPVVHPEQPLVQSTPIPEVGWGLRILIETEMEKLVPNTLSRSSADWLIQDALRDERIAVDLAKRLTQAQGFNGNSTFK